MIYTIGFGIIAFAFLYITFKLDSKHWVLSLITLFFGIYSVMILSNHLVTLESKYYCDIVPITETVSGSVTTIAYDRLCFNSTSQSGLTMFKTLNYFGRNLWAYVFLFVLYYGGMWMLAKVGKYE